MSKKGLTEKQITDLFLHDPNLWPNTLLPIRNPKADETGFPRLAVVAAHDQPNKLRVWYDHNIFNGWPTKLPNEVTPQKLLDDGWIVD